MNSESTNSDGTTLANLPSVEKLRIIYAAAKITEEADPILQTVIGYSEKIIAMTYFLQPDGSIGTAFFCEMKPDWVAPGPIASEENIKKLDEL